MAQFLVRRSDVTPALKIERIEPERLVVEFPEVNRQVGRIEGLGPVIEDTGRLNTRRIRVRQQLVDLKGNPLPSGLIFVANVPLTRIGEFVRRPNSVDMGTLEQLDREVQAAEQNLAETRRRQRAFLVKAFEGAKPVSRNEMTSAATTRLMVERAQNGSA